MKRLLPALLLLGCLSLAEDHPPAGAAASGHGESSGHGGGHGGPSIYWKWANFAILAAGLGYLISRNAPAYFRARTDSIRKAIEDAEQARDAATKRAAEIDRKMADLEGEIEAIREEARRWMADESRRGQEETARLTARIQQQAEQEIASMVQQAGKALRAEAAGLALEIARGKIQSRLTPELHGRLIDSFAERLRPPAGGMN